MKDTKSLTLLLLSSVLFLLSIILLCTWGYQYYHQIQEDKSKAITQTVPKNASEINDATRDSLLKIYKTTLNSIDERADSAYTIADSLNGQLDINLKEFYRLRDEISTLLKSQTPGSADLLLARKKITELQQRVELLRYKNSDVANENIRLKKVIEQLAKTKKTEGSTDNGNSVQALINKPGITQRINAPTGSLIVLRLSLQVLDNAAETNETNTEKIAGTFTVKNKYDINSWSDIMVVVTQPDGQVVQKSAWESGSFNTKEGKRIYSLKIRCETDKGESKKLNFSLNPDNFQKGNYTMKLYHNGTLIGKLQKILS
jgi:flagellar motility protein MotE (MotC chaperone)